MASARDEQFWKRFSTAVHLNEEAQAQAVRPELKHTYVSPALLSDPTTTTTTISATSSTAILPRYPPPTIKSPSSYEQPPSPPLSKSPPSSAAPRRQPSLLRKDPPTRKPSTLHIRTTSSSKPSPFFPSTPTSLSRPNTSTARNPLDPPSPFQRSFHNGSRHTLSLNLSGRPSSRFAFRTIVTADPSHRESWLEEQRRKSKKRGRMCWCFWLTVFAVVAGIVVTVLVLRGRGII